MAESVEIVHDQVAQAMARIRYEKDGESITNALMLLRSLGGKELDPLLHMIARRIGERAKLQSKI